MSSGSATQRQKSELGPNTALLAMLLVMLLEAALHQNLPHEGVVYDAVLSLLLIACVYAVSADRRTLIVGAALGIPAIAIQWLNSTAATATGIHLSLALVGGFFLFVTVTTLRSVLRSESVRLDTIVGAITVYLLIGVGSMVAFGALEHAEPGSFLRAGQPISIEIGRLLGPDLFYFSFVTLTTLGYGDITPATDVAQLLAITEAIMGQLYIAILIASLVAKRISQFERPDS